MPYNLHDFIVIGVSTSALFDLTQENKIFQEEGLEAFVDYQVKHEKDILKKGIAFNFIQSLLDLNKDNNRKIEIMIISRNNTETSLRIFNSIEYYQLDISRAIFTSGEKLEPYFNALKIDLFLSTDKGNVQKAIDQSIPSALVLENQETLDCIKIAYNNCNQTKTYQHFIEIIKKLQNVVKSSNRTMKTYLITNDQFVNELESEIEITEVYVLEKNEKEGELLKRIDAQLYYQ